MKKWKEWDYLKVVKQSQRQPCARAKSLQSCLTLCDPVDRLPWPWDSPSKNTWVGCYFLLHGIFPTQGLNSGLMFPGLAGEFFTTGVTWEASTKMARWDQKLYMHSYPHKGPQSVEGTKKGSKTYSRNELESPLICHSERSKLKTSLSIGAEIW